MSKLHTSLSAVMLVACTTAARAAVLDTYVCNIGDISYSVTLDANLPHDAFVDISVSEMVDKSLARKFYISGRRAPSGFTFKGEKIEFFGKGNAAFLMLESERYSCELQPAKR